MSDQPIRELLVRSTVSVSGNLKENVLDRLTLVVLPLVDILKVVDSRIVVVLAGEHDVINVARVRVRDRMACLVSVIRSRSRQDILLVSYLPKPVTVSAKPLRGTPS